MQFALASLVKKMAIEHPYHTILQVYWQLYFSEYYICIYVPPLHFGLLIHTFCFGLVFLSTLFYLIDFIPFLENPLYYYPTLFTPFHSFSLTLSTFLPHLSYFIHLSLGLLTSVILNIWLNYSKHLNYSNETSNMVKITASNTVVKVASSIPR